MPQWFSVCLDCSPGHSNDTAAQFNVFRGLVGPRDKCQGKRGKLGVSAILSARSKIEGGEECDRLTQISTFPDRRHLLKKFPLRL